MGHELEFTESGRAMMFSVKEMPWHHLVTPLPEAPTIEQVQQIAFPWEVEMREVYVKQPTVDGSEAFEPTRYRAACRSDTGAILGVHGPNWTPLLNKELVETFRPWYEKELVTFETAGTLRGGRLVWVLGRITDDPIDVVPGDPILPFVLGSNGHDGVNALKQGLVRIRPVCANTEEAASRDEASQLIRTYHHGNIAETASMVFEALDLARRQFRADVELYQELAKRPIDEDGFRSFVKLVFTKDSYKTKEDQAIAEVAAERHIDEVLPLMEVGRGMDIKGVRGTWWGAYNSVSEYLNHSIGNSASARLGSQWFGKNKNLNKRAIRKAAELALT